MNIREYNLDLIEPLVRTQYGDYGGYIQIDGHGGADLFKLCEDHGVDIEKYFLIGFSCGEHTTGGIGKREKVYCSAIVLETKEYGYSFDQIKQKLNSSNGEVKAKQITFEVNYRDFGTDIKRFEFAVATKLTKHITEVKIKETNNEF